jgi:nucleotide-binding universal stress UspA family protein
MVLTQRTVLVPLDGLPLAETALPLARLFADALGAHLDLLQVVPADGPAGADQRAHAYLDGVAATLVQDGFAVSTRVMRGDPGECIVREATAEHIDLLVISTHARSGFRRAVRGSVAEYAIAHVPAPTVVVRAGLHREPRLETLLLAIDPSYGAPLAPTIELAKATGAHVVLLTVVRHEATYVWQWRAGELLDEPQTVVGARMQLEELAERMRDAGVSADVHVAIGPAAQSIQTVCTTTNADLIIMSTHARTGLQRAMLGSTADRVMHLADRPVLLFRLAVPQVAQVRPIDVYHVFQHQGPVDGPQSIAEPPDHVRHETITPRWRHLPEAVSTGT